MAPKMTIFSISWHFEGHFIPPNKNLFQKTFFYLSDKVLTFSKWPYRIFYDYFQRLNTVFCENDDFG